MAKTRNVTKIRLKGTDLVIPKSTYTRLSKGTLAPKSLINSILKNNEHTLNKLGVDKAAMTEVIKESLYSLSIDENYKVAMSKATLDFTFQDVKSRYRSMVNDAGFKDRGYGYALEEAAESGAMDQEQLKKFRDTFGLNESDFMFENWVYNSKKGVLEDPTGKFWIKFSDDYNKDDGYGQMTLETNVYE